MTQQLGQPVLTGALRLKDHTQPLYHIINYSTGQQLRNSCFPSDQSTNVEIQFIIVRRDADRKLLTLFPGIVQRSAM